MAAIRPASAIQAKGSSVVMEGVLMPLPRHRAAVCRADLSTIFQSAELVPKLVLTLFDFFTDAKSYHKSPSLKP
jgi:hypothetical protein